MKAARDEEFVAFFRREFGAVVRAAYVLTGDRAGSEDVAQEAFARLYGHWRRVSRYERPDAWVRRVAINLAVSSLRRRPEPARPTTSLDARDPDLHQAILRLPRGQKIAVVLHYYEDRPIAEIATIMGCAASTVKTHLHRARSTLASNLAERDDDAS